ncbi:MAG: plasmid stabilization protein [Isosphaera sp.]|nr:plasmid stabilization protein [Isosphaera sp.]
MATLTITDLPPSTLAYLAARAARANRTVEEEARALLASLSPADGPEYIPSPEITAPFDPELPGPGVPIVPRDGGPARLEFWFDEDKVRE